jgi:Flp pilus assembly protein TadG
VRTGRQHGPVRHRGHRAGPARPVPTRTRGHRSRRPRRSWRDDGNSSVELVLFMPLLFLAIFATVQFGLMYLGNSAASSAAREAARIARAGGGGDEAIAAAQARGQEILANIGKGVIQGDGDIAVQQFAGEPDQIQVTVTVQGVGIIPGLPTPEIKQVVRGPVEEFDADD